MNRSEHARILRLVRKVHRYMGIFLFMAFLLMAITGSLLGWKKNSAGYLLPETMQGTSTNLASWHSVDQLKRTAQQTVIDSLGAETDTLIDRIDIRPDKGILKFTFQKHYGEVQLDGATGKVLSVGQRRSDFLESVHDGSILDRITGNTTGLIKLFYTSLMGTALMLFSVTGFWLWYGPKRMKRKKST